MIKHIVKSGDCILSIAERYGFYWETIWDYPSNSQLRVLRRDPNILNPGDIVVVPNKQIKEESGTTEQRHRFRRKGTPARLRLQLLNRDFQPRAGVSYILEVDGALKEGTTNRQGLLEAAIPPGAVAAVLTYDNEDGFPMRRRLQLGGVDPHSEERGIRQRLANLGYYDVLDGGFRGLRTGKCHKVFPRIAEDRAERSS